MVIGAQAVYLHTGSAAIALAEATKDSDLALDTRLLADKPLIQEAMRSAGFVMDVTSAQPGAWLSPSGIPVDLMVPEALAGGGGRQARAARLPPHGAAVARRAVGVEAAVVDHAPVEVTALSDDDTRRYTANVAGPAGLLVAKLHKLGERLVADQLAGFVTERAVVYLREMFADGAKAEGSMRAGRAEEGVGEPDTVAAAASALAEDLLASLKRL